LIVCDCLKRQHLCKLNEDAHRADPAAERAPEDKRERDRDERKPQQPRHRARGQERRQEVKRIDLEQQLDGQAHVVGAAILRLHEQEEKYEKENDLRGDAQPADHHRAPSARFRGQPIPRFSEA
jgi:hypothetical protein